MKELSEDQWSRIVGMHEAEKGYKSVSKSLDVHVSIAQTLSVVKNLGLSASYRKNWLLKNLPKKNIKQQWKSWEDTTKEAIAVQKKHCCMFQVCKRAA